MERKKYLFWGIILMIYLSQPNILWSQGMIIDVPLEQRVQKSENIFQGEIVGKVCKWNDSRNSIYTLNYIKVLDDIQENLEVDTIIVLTYGGTVGMDKQIDFPSLKLDIGDLGLFMVRKSDKIINGYSQLYEITYLSLGFVKYDLEKDIAYDHFSVYEGIEKSLYKMLNNFKLAPKKDVLVARQILDYRSPDAVNISSFSPTSTTAGTMTTLTINGTGFGATQGNGKVEFRNADNGGSGYMSPIQDEYVSWSDTQIKVKIPSGAGTGDIKVTDNSGSSDVSSSDITINYNITNITYNSKKYRANLVNSDGSGGIEFEFYTDFYNNTAARDAYERALGTWRCNYDGTDGTGVYFADGGSSTVDVIADDGVNIVRFDNGNELSSNVLGRMTSRYSGCSSGGGPVEWYVRELDVVFNDVPANGSYTWNFSEPDNSTGSNQYDFESVAVHEIGHGHQLGHVIDALQIMHYSISNGQEKRELSSDDLDAGNDVLSFSGSTCTKPEMDDFVCAVLPLTLKNFDAILLGKEVRLNWEFESFKDLDYLVLQRSYDGMNFDDLKEFSLESEANYSNAGRFEYIDKPEASENYYRLKIYDIDGSFFYSKKLYLFNKKISIGVNAYPNPLRDELAIENTEKEDIDIEIVDETGIVVFSRTVIKGLGIKKINIDNLSTGLYLLKIYSKSGIEIKKLIKNR